MRNLIAVLLFNITFFTSFSQTNIYTLLGHRSAINTLAFSKDGKYLLSGSRDSSIAFWNIDNNFGLEKKVTVSNASITSISFSPSGKELSVSTYKRFLIYKYPEFKKICARQKAHSSFVECANFSANGEMLVTSSWRDNSLILWNNKFKKVKAFAETEWTDNAIFVSGDKYIASVNHNNTIKLWDVKGGNLVRTFAGHTDWVYDLFITKDEKYLVSCALDKTIKIWDFNSGKLFKSIIAHEDGVTSLCLSDDGKYFASTSLDKTTKIWNADEFVELAQLKGHTESVLAAKFSPNGKYLATASSDSTIKIWDILPLVNVKGN
jgi:WD40 repeat protein